MERDETENSEKPVKPADVPASPAASTKNAPVPLPPPRYDLFEKIVKDGARFDPATTYPLNRSRR